MGNVANLRPFAYPKGVSGNPGGKPTAARNRFTAAFVRAFTEDFEEHGPEVIARVRKTNPTAYLRVGSSLVEKQFDPDTMDDVETLIQLMKDRLAKLRTLTDTAGVGAAP